MTFEIIPYGIQTPAGTQTCTGVSPYDRRRCDMQKRKSISPPALKPPAMPWPALPDVYAPRPLCRGGMGEALWIRRGTLPRIGV